MIRDPDDFDPAAFEAHLEDLENLPQPRAKAIGAFHLAMTGLSVRDQQVLLMALAAEHGFAVAPLSGLPEDSGPLVAKLREIHAKSQALSAEHKARREAGNPAE